MATIFLIIALLAISGTAVALTAYLGLASRADAVLSVALIVMVLVVVDSLALGAVSLFSRWPLIALALVQLIGAGALVAVTPAATERITGLPAALRTGAVDVLGALRRNLLAAALFVVTGVLMLWRVTVVAMTGVADYDGLSYHMPMVYSWVQDHRVGQRILVNSISDAYPGNLELHAAWTMAIYGNDQWAGLAQAPFVLLGAIAVVAVARRFDLGLGWALAAAAMFLITPVVVAQVGMIYNDVASVAAFVAGLHFAGRIFDSLEHPRTATGYALLAGLGLGLAAGIKPPFVLGSVVAGVLILVGLCWRLRAWRRPLLLVGLVGVLVAILGAPFYVRNILIFGNPLAPFAFELGPMKLPGPLDLETVTIKPSTPPEMREFGWLKTPAYWFGYQVDPATYGVQGNVQGSLGWQWPVLLVPAAIGWIALLVARRRAWYPALLLIPMILVFLTHPTPWIFRYMLFLVVPAVVAFCLLLQWLAARPGKLGPAACVALSAVMLVLAVLPFQDAFVARAGYPGVTVTRAMDAPDFIRAAVQKPGVRTCAQPGTEWVGKLPDGTVIGVGRDFSGCLYGERAQQRVIGLPSDRTLLAKFLHDHSVRYVFATDASPHGVWFREHPEQYQLFYAAGKFRAYKVR